MDGRIRNSEYKSKFKKVIIWSRLRKSMCGRKKKYVDVLLEDFRRTRDNFEFFEVCVS